MLHPAHASVADVEVARAQALITQTHGVAVIGQHLRGATVIADDLAGGELRMLEHGDVAITDGAALRRAATDLATVAPHPPQPAGRTVVRVRPTSPPTAGLELPNIDDVADCWHHDLLSLFAGEISIVAGSA